MSEPIYILDVKIDPLDVQTLNRRIVDFVEQEEHAIVVHVNTHGLNLAYHLPWLRQFYNNADVTVCDGVGPILAGRILGLYIPERITYADWIWQLAELSQSRDFSLFLLGGRPGVACKSAERLRAEFPRLRVLGVHHGFFDKTKGSSDNKVVIEKINAVRPNILLVGFGMPLQERWLLENWECIDANVGMGPGALFDYLSGEIERAPEWMTNNGLEWLGRLTFEPRRLWRRYVIGNPLFMLRVLKQRLK